MAIQLNNNIKINAGKPLDVKYLSSSNLPYVSESEVTTQIPIAERSIGLTVNIANSEYWFATGVTNSDLVLKFAASGSTLNGVQNVGTGTGNVYSGVTAGGTINLRSLKGSGDTVVSTSGDTVVIYTTGGTDLSNGILRFDSAAQTFQPYSAFTSGITFYEGTTSPTGITRLNINALLAVTELRLSTGSTHTIHNVGDLYWDNEDSTVSLQQTVDVKQQIGQELYVKVKNPTAGQIPNGTVVYISGSDSGRPTILPARASDLDSGIIDEIIGMTTENIPAGGTGFVTTSGLVRDIVTSGFTEGDIAWLSPTVAGAITATKPIYPNYAIEIGIITIAHAVSGSSLIRIINSSETNPNIRGIETVGPPYTASTRTDVIAAVGSGTYYLPLAPVIGQQITVLDKDGDAGIFTITINGNGQPINSKSDDITPNYVATINTNFGSMTLLYLGGTSPNYGWRIINSNP